MEITVLSACLGASILLNAYLVYRIRKTPKQLTTNAKQLLKSLMGGGAVLKIHVLNPDEIYMRSPRDL